METVFCFGQNKNKKTTIPIIYKDKDLDSHESVLYLSYVEGLSFRNLDMRISIGL